MRSDAEQSSLSDLSVEESDRSIESIIQSRIEECDSDEERADLINRARKALHDGSPFEEPVDHVQWVDTDNVEGNDYNPNEVATPEMDLLRKSIDQDGFTQPVVTYQIGESEYEVVDGFHRTLLAKEDDGISDRLDGYVPVTVIDKPKDERMGSTIRHNRARGTHQIRDMSNLVTELVQRGWDDQRIGEELGMELDEVLRLKQVSGLKEAFSGHEFSQSWTEYKDRHDDGGESTEETDG
jgi:ParB-like chromosome segregation protein Spo0J